MKRKQKKRETAAKQTNEETNKKQQSLNIITPNQLELKNVLVLNGNEEELKRKTPEINPEFCVSSNKLLDLLKQYAAILLEKLASKKCITSKKISTSVEVHKSAEADCETILICSSPSLWISIWGHWRQVLAANT